MLQPTAVKIWSQIHTWTSLICTLFLLMLCLTGLPLIFAHEIQHALSDHKEPVEESLRTQAASLERVVASAMEASGGKAVQSIFIEPGEEEVINVAINESAEAPMEQAEFVQVDAFSAEVLAANRVDEGIVYFLFKLHVDMFLGLGGKLFLGVMALLFVLSLISGVIVYEPFMRRRSFGQIEREKGPRRRWLDLHNALGMVVLAWALVVGATGMINTWADLVLSLWQQNELAEMIAEQSDSVRELPEELASLDKSVAVALEREPEMDLSFVAYPGTKFSSANHYTIFLRGSTPLTARLLKPTLIDAETGEFTSSRPMPWYVNMLLISQPLHFGDYGGMPMKILWALLDIISILVLASGLYVWWKRLKASRNRNASLRSEEAPKRQLAA